MCLICNERIAVLKEYNIWRHHNEKQQSFQINYPEGLQEMSAKVQSLMESYSRSCAMMVRSSTAQERAPAASLRVSWILAKKRPFTDLETMKECMAVVEVIQDEKLKRGH